MEVKSENYERTAKELLEILRKNIIENQDKELKKLGKEINIKELKEENGEVFFYIIVDKGIYKVNQDEIKYIGQQSEKSIKLDEGKLEFSNEIWQQGKANVTISSNTNYAIQYQINTTDGKWIIGTEVRGLLNGDIIYARLFNETDEGKIVSHEIKDLKEPEVATLTVGNTNSDKSIELSVVASDNESGVDKYEIYVNNELVTTNANYKITDMPFYKEYTCYVVVTDIAGNKKESNRVITRNEEYISDEVDIKNFANTVNSGISFQGKTITQIKDINLNCSNTNQWIPIGASTDKTFEGIYNGNKKTISNIYINSSSDYQGLFGFINGATIKDLGLISGTITGKSLVGGIAATAYNKSTIQNCYNSNALNITGTENYIAGIVAEIKGNSEILDSYNKAFIKGNGFIAGVTAAASNGAKIDRCYNNGNISANGQYVGGICGSLWINDSGIYCCYNTGNINNIGPSTGGIVGQAASEVVDCYNKGIITSDSRKSCGNLRKYMVIWKCTYKL